MQSLNISPYLFGFGKNNATRSSASASNPLYGNRGSSGNSGNSGWFPRSMLPGGMNVSTASSGSGWSSIKQIGSYFLAVAIVVIILLLFIHFFIRPVFRWKPGAPGWISLPGWDDGVLFWSKGNTGPIPNDKLPIQNQSFDYTLQVDLFLENPLQFATRPRLLLARGGILKSPLEGDTLLGILRQYNLAVALKPDTNDMIVSVLNNKNQMENAILPNVPVQEPFRLTVVVMERAMEVYLNGHLQQTTTFQLPPLDVKGEIAPASGTEANIVRYRNLKIWSRVLTTPEIREIRPPLSTATEMGAGPIPSSSSMECPSPSPSPSP